jgi:hypothetical protein
MCDIRFLRRRVGRYTRYFSLALQPLHSITSAGQQLVCCAGLHYLGWGRRWRAPAGGSYIVLRLTVVHLQKKRAADSAGAGATCWRQRRQQQLTAGFSKLASVSPRFAQNIAFVSDGIRWERRPTVAALAV